MPFTATRTNHSLPFRYIPALLFLLTISIPVVQVIFQSRTCLFVFKTRSTSPRASVMSPAISDARSSSRTPVYFLGIGGPNFMEAKDHPAYAKLAEVGQEITSAVKPNAVVVFSAHWQHGPSTVAINVAEKTDLIYDFHGFPPHYYEYEFPNKGSPELAERVVQMLSGAGISVDRTQRGLDHGVWVGFLAAFDPLKNALDVPIVQVSLFASDDPNQHYHLGQALEQLRNEGVLIIGAGMAVHNLMDFRKARGNGKLMPYASTFEEGVGEAVMTEPAKRQSALTALLKRDDARQAHPSFEHILPLHVVAGAAGSDTGKRVWAFPEGSLNWAQYRFGDITPA
nr:4,5-dopa dioxygenase extradiol [Quercus suber]